MSNAGAQRHGVMEGKGSYNKHARLPAGGAALAMPLLEKAVQSLELEPGEQSIVIADYGSSQGKNSMAPMQVAIRGLRDRIGPSRAISIFHIDQPSNDFNTLFSVLHGDSDRYVIDEPNVFPAAIGRSFYENVLPPNSAHLAWSSYAAVWLSRIPALIPGHFFYLFSTGSVRAEFERQSAKDWETFLSLRARELRHGGRLVIVPSPMMGLLASNTFSSRRMRSWRKWPLPARSMPTSAQEWLSGLILGGNAICSPPSQLTGNSSSSLSRVARCLNSRTPPGPIISTMSTRKPSPPSTPSFSARFLCPPSPPPLFVYTRPTPS